MTYQVRQADVSEEALAPELSHLWAGSLAMSGDLQARLRWAYGQNPGGSGEVFLLEWLPEDDSPRTVGCAGLLRRAFALHGVELECAMYGDLAVEPEHRSLGPAMLLQRSAGAFVRRNFHFGYGFPNDAASGLARRAGHRQVGKIVRYARVLKHGQYLRRSRAAHLRWAAWAGPAVDALSRVPAILKRVRGPSRSELCWLDRADERFDDLWHDACKRFPMIGDRRHAALNWRFAQKPGGNCRFVALADRSDRLLAYAVIESGGEGSPAVIKDFLARGDEDLEALLDRLAVELSGAGHTSMSVRFLGSNHVVEKLLASGFQVRAEERPFLVDLGERSEGLGLSLDPEGWYLTDGDEDW